MNKVEFQQAELHLHDNGLMQLHLWHDKGLTVLTAIPGTDYWGILDEQSAGALQDVVRKKAS